MSRDDEIKWSSVAEIEKELGDLSRSITEATETYVDAPARVGEEIANSELLVIRQSLGKSKVTIDNLLLAAWINLISTPFDEVLKCSFCEGINVSRKGSQFCSHYCRDRYHKKVRRGGL